MSWKTIRLFMPQILLNIGLTLKHFQKIATCLEGLKGGNPLHTKGGEINIQIIGYYNYKLSCPPLFFC